MGLGMLQTIWLAVVLSFSLYCLSVRFRPLRGERDARGLPIGILGLAYVAMHLRMTYATIFAHLPYSTLLFRVIGAIVGGVWATILISWGFRWGAKAMLTLACILSLGCPLAGVLLWYRMGHGTALHSIFASPKFYIAEAWPIGIAVTAIVLLLRSGERSRKNAGDDGGLTSEDAAENGMGA
jgi:hypothetical protein